MAARSTTVVQHAMDNLHRAEILVVGSHYQCYRQEDQLVQQISRFSFEAKPQPKETFDCKGDSSAQVNDEMDCEPGDTTQHFPRIQPDHGMMDN
ncbi:hypothetical protein MMC14_003522 [Varicellaria rhodocarpa]|nr:hypothetical protein [Varicellaria rhodocarpa]